MPQGFGQQPTGKLPALTNRPSHCLRPAAAIIRPRSECERSVESGNYKFSGGLRYPGRFWGAAATRPLAVLTIEGAGLTIGLRRLFRWLDLFLPTVRVRMDDRVEAEVIHGIIPGNWGIRFHVPSLAESLIFWCSRSTTNRLLEILRTKGVRIRPDIARLI